MKKDYLFVAGVVVFCATVLGFLNLALDNNLLNTFLEATENLDASQNQAGTYSVYGGVSATGEDLIIKFDPYGKFGFVQGCVVPAFGINGQPVCPVAMVINAIGNCCILAAQATRGGVCTRCSDCPRGQGGGACRLICRSTC